MTERRAKTKTKAKAARRPAAAGARPRAARSRPAHRVLVLDDNELAREAAEEIVRGLNHDVLGVGCQDALFDALHDLKDRGQAPCALLLDLEVPVHADGAPSLQNGRATLDRMRAEFPHVPVLVITAFGELDLAIETMKAGASDFEVKPLDNLALKLAALVQKTCAARHPAGCPNVGPGAAPAPPQDADGGGRLVFVGELRKTRAKVVLEGRPAFLREVEFTALGKLAVAARAGKGVFKGALGSGEGNHNVIPRLREQLAKETGLAKEEVARLIVTEGHGSYRLTIPRAGISVADGPHMRDNFPTLLRDLGAP